MATATTKRKGRKAKQIEGVGTYFDPASITPISDLVRMEIDSRNVSLAQVAVDAEVCVSTVSRLYNGQVKSPQMRTCVSILQALGYRVQVVR